jgi:hypothetical protein
MISIEGQLVRRQRICGQKDPSASLHHLTLASRGLEEPAHALRGLFSFTLSLS